jgi:hypothetical protein
VIGRESPEWSVAKADGPEAISRDLLDPTANVIALVHAEARRQDDLRESERRRVDDLRMEEAKRLDERAGAERRRIDEQIKLRAEFSAQIREAETKRLDAIRVVDVNNISIANERAVSQATVLATQVSTSAETLRALVTSTAATIAAQLAQVTTQLSDRVASLEKMGYVGTGKQAVADPLQADLTAEIKAIKENLAMHKGRSVISTQMIVVGATIIGGLLMFLVQRLFK